MDDLNVLLAEETTLQQVVQETLYTPEAGDQQLSVLSQDVHAGHVGFFYLDYYYRSTITSVKQETTMVAFFHISTIITSTLVKGAQVET